MPTLHRPRLTIAEQRQEIPRAVLALVDANNAIQRELAALLVQIEAGGGGGEAELTETGGPTELAMGAVADGEFLKRSGTTVIGGTPPAGAPGVTLRGFRSRDQGGGYVNQVSRVHIAGYANTGGVFAGNTVSNLQSIGAGQMAYAIPDYFERAGVINRLAIRTNGTVGTGGAPRLRMAVYANATLAAGSLAGSPYPGALLGQSASLDMWSGAANRILETVGLSISVAAGTYVWFAAMYNAQAVTNQHGIPVFGYLYPILGFTFNAVNGTTLSQDAQTSGVGWRHAVTFGTTEDFPDPFPQTTPVILTDGVLTGAGANIPVIGYGFQPS